MKQVFTFLFFLLCSMTTTAQLDKSNGNNANGKTIGVINVPVPVKEVTRPKSLDFKNDNGFKTANEKQEQKRKQEERKREEEQKGIITKDMIAKKNFKKNIEGNRLNFPMIDMDLGSFHTKSKFIYITSLDFGRFDGDKVSIAANGERIHNNYLLTPKLKTIKVPLKIGINKIEVTALNEGQLAPNTGYFAFFDDQKQVIKEGQWMLATGAKVIAIVVRDEK